MALHFKKTYITDYGYQLISRAIGGGSFSSEPRKIIEWGVARTSDVDLHSARPGEIVAKDLSDFASNFTSEGYVTKAAYNEVTDGGNTSHTITLSCELNNTDYEQSDPEHGGGFGLANTLIICAKIKDDSTIGPNVAIIAIVDVESGYSAEDIPQHSVSPWSASISLLIDLKDNAIESTSIKAPDNYYATAQDLNDLAGRVVTTYKDRIGNAPYTYTGDNQDVYGTKTFKTGVVIDAGSQLVSNGTVTFNTNNVTTQKVSPAGNKAHDLGADSHRWKTVYSDKGDFSDKVTSSTLEVTGTSTLTGSVTTGAITADGITSSSGLTVAGQSTFNGASTFNDNVTVATGKTITGNLSGKATQADQDGEGNVIKDYYCTLGTPQTLTGEKTFDSGKLIVKSDNGSGLSIKNANSSANLSFNTYCNYSNYNDFSLSTGLKWKNNSTLKEFTTKWVMSNSNDNATITSITTTPPETEKWSLGTSSNKLKEVYAVSFKGNAESATALSYINGSTKTTKLSAAVPDYIVAHDDIVPNYTNQYDLGSTNWQWRNIYANTLYGTLVEDTAHSIFGIVEDGSTGPFYNGLCLTTASTAEKVVDCSGFTLTTGAVITVSFTQSSPVASSPTLNVNSTGAKPIIAGSDVATWSAQSLKTFRYNGAEWVAIKTNMVSNYGVCSTASDSSTKVVTISNSSFRLEKGARVIVKFTYYNSASYPYLNVNSTGAKRIKKYSTVDPGGTAFDSWVNDSTIEFVYDGTYWVWVGYQYYAGSSSYVGILGNSSSNSYPLVFTSSVNSSTTNRENKTLYTDTENSLYYNPSTNALRVGSVYADTLHGNIVTLGSNDILPINGIGYIFVVPLSIVGEYTLNDLSLKRNNTAYHYKASENYSLGRCSTFTRLDSSFSVTGVSTTGLAAAAGSSSAIYATYKYLFTVNTVSYTNAVFLICTPYITSYVDSTKGCYNILQSSAAHAYDDNTAFRIICGNALLSGHSSIRGGLMLVQRIS